MTIQLVYKRLRASRIYVGHLVETTLPVTSQVLRSVIRLHFTEDWWFT